MMAYMVVSDISPANSGARRDNLAHATVLGIDPGLQRTGYALLSAGTHGETARLHEAGVIRLQTQNPMPDRLCELDEHLRQLIDRHEPITLACEELYAHYKHPRTAILMGHARGVVLLAAARARLAIIPVAATNVKKLLTGSGRATKRQVQLAVTATLGLPHVPEPNDVADAIAIALCGMHLMHERQVAGQDGRTPR